MKNMINWLTKYGYKFREAEMTSGQIGVFVEIEDIKREDKDKLMKYVRRYHRTNYEFRGHYTSLLVKFDKEENQKKTNEQMLQEEFGKMLLPRRW